MKNLKIRIGANFLSPRLHSHGFTLVELIVVITILVILGTIAFISLQGYGASARDSARMENLTNLGKWLNIFQITSGAYPMPENAVSITASGTPVGYQGFAKDMIGSLAKISSWGTTDPLDPSIRTTYLVNPDKTKMQLMAFLEDRNSVTAYAENTSFADAGSDYSKRIPIIRWDSLGILLASGSLRPIQESATGVDIVNTTGSYTMYTSIAQQFSGTGQILKAGIVSDGMVGFWNFDEGSGTTAYDTSGNGNNGTMTGGMLSWTGGILGWALYFSGGYVNAGNRSSLQMSTDVTMSLWIKIPASYNGLFVPMGKYASVPEWCPDSAGYHLGGYVNYNSQYLWFFWWRNCSWTYYSSQVNKVLNDNAWHHMSGVKQGTRWITYIDGERSEMTSPTIGNINANAIDLLIGKWANYPVVGTIDEVRIYNRALSDFEIQTLYKSTK